MVGFLHKLSCNSGCQRSQNKITGRGARVLVADGSFSQAAGTAHFGQHVLWWIPFPSWAACSKFARASGRDSPSFGAMLQGSDRRRQGVDQGFVSQAGFADIQDTLFGRLKHTNQIT